jgi:hypothetical protein
MLRAVAATGMTAAALRALSARSRFVYCPQLALWPDLPK